MRKKYIPYICIFVVAIVLFFSILFTNTKKTKVITFRKNYDISNLVSEKDSFKLDLFINNKKSYFVDKNQIEECYLISKDSDNILELEINDIINNESKLKYGKENYYNFTFDFNINLKIDSFYNWNIKNAYLFLKYTDNKIYNLNIGNVTYNKIEDKENETFTFTNIKAVSTNIYDNSYLSGIMIGIRSLNDSFSLDRINILNSSVTTGKEIIKLDKIKDNQSFKEIAGYDYSQQVKGSGEVNDQINDTLVHYYFIPLYYEDKLLINKFPLEFVITKNDVTIKEYLVNYVFYDVQSENIKKENIHIYDVK